MQIYVIATFNDNNYVEKKDTHVDSAIYIIHPLVELKF